VRGAGPTHPRLEDLRQREGLDGGEAHKRQQRERRRRRGQPRHSGNQVSTRGVAAGERRVVGGVVKAA